MISIYYTCHCYTYRSMYIHYNISDFDCNPYKCYDYNLIYTLKLHYLLMNNYPFGGYLRCALSASLVTMGPDACRGLVS